MAFRISSIARYLINGVRTITKVIGNADLPGLTRGPYPRVVIPHAKADKGRTSVMHQHLGEFEDQRVSGIKGYIHLTA